MAKIKQVLLLLAIMVTTSQGQQAPCSFAITVDGSSSVDANQFQQQKDFIKRLITRIDISGDSNAGLAQFASTSQIHIKCNDAATSSAFNTLVDGVNLMSGATCIKCGLDKAQELLSGNGCGRTGENKIIFLMVDGNENIFPNEVVTTATNLRNAGYVIYALAIGNVVDAAMVATLTGSSDRVFRTQFADLATYDIETLYGALGSTCAASTSGWASWGLWSACSATCDPVGVTPSRSRTRSCPSGATCPGSNTESESCNGNVLCPGVLSQWSQWSTCSSTCRASGANAPTRTRTRRCDNPSLGGNCGGASLTETENCNDVSCTVIQWAQWGQWSACSATCDPVGFTPSRTRTRSCSGGSTCPGSATESGSCNANLACPGVLTQWTQWSACAATCRTPGSSPPVRTRTRSCTNPSLGGNCNNAVLVEREDCNTDACTGNVLSQWSQWGPCSATCQSGNTIPQQTRTRTCSGTCTGVSTLEQRNCNAGVSCNVISCSNANISYIIVIDSSSSVKTSLPDEWSQEKTFVKNFAAQLGLGTNSRIRVGVVNYGSAANIVATCDSTATSNLANFNALIDGLPRQLGGTAINDALLKARELYTGAGCNRAGELRVVLFLTDGYENIVFDDALRVRTENLVRSEALVYVGAIGPEVRLPELVRVTGNSSLIFTANNFLELSNIDAAALHPRIVSQVCQVGGVWGSWSAFGACSISCGARGVRTRTRECRNPITNALQSDCAGSATDTETCFDGDCAGAWSQWSDYGACSATCHSGPVGSPPTQMRTRTCDGATGAGNCGGGSTSETRSCNVQVACPGSWSNWGTYGTCSETCQSNLNTAPTQSRTRTCTGGTFGGSCPGSSLDSRNCNVGVSCPGTLTQWSAYGDCSASCQSGLQAPTQQRTRSCVGATFGGNCNGAVLVQNTDCNVEVACPGSLTQWTQWGSCSETCQSNPNVAPTRSKTRQCVGASFGGNCGGASLTMTGTCNVGIGCQGQWSNWGAYGSCSETCQSNVNTVPTQSRTRTCNGGTFNTTCPGSAVGTQNCNVGVACQGSLTQWSGYGACSATCQSGLQAPTQQRTRRCVGATFAGNCNGALLVQTTDCNVEVACPGTLTQWAQWGACSENCQSNPNVAPTRSRTRQCVGASFGGNCGGEILTMTGACNVGVGCQGQWSNWGAYGSCSETCQSDVNTSPTQSRTRTCNGGTFGTTCPGSAVDTRNCNVGVACQGTLTQWTSYGACSATCQLNLQAPTQQRSRTCERATFGGNCNGAVLVQTTDCNVEVACPGVLSQWTQWSACSETCETGAQQTRTRTCTNTSFGGNCNGASLTESRTCNDGVPCPGVPTQWSQWSACSATCQLGGTSPTRTRTRFCQGATQGGNCGGAILSETENCNFQVGCPGTLTQWGPWNPCSSTCQANATITPSRARIRFCINTSFNGNCFGASLQQTESCNVGVICPVPGTWTQWGQWSTCSKTCDMGARSRSRTCTDPFPANAGNDCVGSSTSTSTCKIADCPVACPVQKRCNCSLAPQFPTTAPALGYFNIDDATIHAAINTLTYWTKEIQNQICESCNLQRLQVSVNTVTSHVNQVKAMIDRLNEIKKRLRDIINCNNNVFIGSELWALYDYLYTRCTMLNGVYTELSACKMRFEAANNSCKKYGWFHQLMKQVYRKW